MPLYEFHCEKCGQDSELLVRSSDWTGAKCPQCGSSKLAKKFSTFASSSPADGGDAGACGTGSGGGGGGGCCGCASGRPHKH